MLSKEKPHKNPHLMQIYCLQQLSSTMKKEKKVSVITSCVSQRG